MVPKLKVSQKLIDRLTTVKHPCIGKLYGILYRDTLLIVTSQLDLENQLDLVNNLPAEIDLCGVLEVGDGTIGDKVLQLIRDVDITDTPVYMSCTLGEPSEVKLYLNIDDKMESVVFDVMSENEIASQFVHIRVTSQLPVTTCGSAAAIGDHFLSLRRQLIQGQVAFNIPKTNIFIMGNDCDNGIVGITGDPTVAELCEQSGVSSEGNIDLKKKKFGNFEKTILTAKMFKKATRETNTDGPKLHSPLVHVEKKFQQTLIATINVNALSMVHKDTKVVQLYPILVESCCRYLRLYQTEILKAVEDSEINEDCLSEMETFQFLPEECGHFITKIYPKNVAEDALVSERKQLHLQLHLPLTRPIFRRTNKFLFHWDLDENGPLVNPHESIAHPGNGEVALVKGKYRYYHYSQNNMDDNGWGCAYRSLQTLASWLNMQGYTTRDVPNFTEIQQCLVKIGDKPPNFVGSKQWIGSTEVSMVLNSLCGITCKIMHVNSGEDMGTVGPRLLNHFKTQGSPVMIGGGVLAHTILGVCYNQQMGDITFLILDPHYTGGEDLQVIQKKGWCGWKSVTFWDKTSFYNMCLPQTPHCF